jgi:3-methylcrotonyl-CoA carboxylase alpha subunit
MGDARSLAARVTRLLWGEEEHEVSLRSSADGLEVVVDGRSFRPDVVETAPGTFVLRSDGRAATFHCVRDRDGILLHWDGATYRLEEPVEGASSGHRPAAGGLEAPMPGKVIAVKVEVGQRVAKGEEVLVVEAMKMENAVRAPRSGTIKSVTVSVGDKVSPGVTLVELD